MIPDIVDCNLNVGDQILIVFGTSIHDTTGHQITVQVFISHNVCFCTIPANVEGAKYALKWTKTSIIFVSPDLWPPSFLTSVHSLTMIAVSCSSESIGRCLGMSMNSRSDWLKSGAKRCRHCYQWMEKASACQCSQNFKYLLLAVGQLDNWIHCQPKWQKSGLNVLYVYNFN